MRKSLNAFLPAAAIALLMAPAILAHSATDQLGSRSAEDWIALLEAPARVAALKVDEIIGRLELAPGQVVADLGAGTGVFSLPLAQAVAPAGKVYAVDIDPALVDYIRQKAEKRKVTNVVPVLGKPGDPALPAADVDLVFMHDVLHHIEDRVGYLKQTVRYLKPSARMAFVEMDPVKGAHRNDAKLQLTPGQLAAWMADLGFVQTATYPVGDDKWYVVYSRKA
jgi:ubiquinone/menaquinone biosynthesis C-methylase UbiE